MTLLKRWKAAARHRDMPRALYGLSAHFLRDIGVGRQSSLEELDRHLRDAPIRRI